MEIREAGFWRRATALMLDMVITSPLVSLVKSVAPDMLLQLSISLVLFTIYVVVAFASRWEATIGMKLLKVKVVNAEGARLGAIGALRWIGMGLVVSAVCMAPVLWFFSLVFEHYTMAELLTAQNSGQNPAVVLLDVANKEGLTAEEMDQYRVMSLLSTLLLFIFWMLTVAVLPKKRGIHNWFAKTYMVKAHG